MGIRADFLPRDFVWVMYNNRPEQFSVVTVKITILEDMNIEIIYVLATEVGPKEYCSSKVFGTKEELKQSIFG